MLPSLGLFGDVDCPFYEVGKCGRAHCHYRHRPTSIGVTPSFWKQLDIISEEIKQAKSADPPAPPKPEYVPAPISEQAADEIKIIEEAAQPPETVEISDDEPAASVEEPPTTSDDKENAPEEKKVAKIDEDESDAKTSTKEATNDRKRKSDKPDTKSSKVRKKEDGSREKVNGEHKEEKGKQLPKDRQKKLEEIAKFLADVPDLITTVHTALKEAVAHAKKKADGFKTHQANIKDWYADYCETTGRKYRKSREEKKKSDSRKRRKSSSDHKTSERTKRRKSSDHRRKEDSESDAPVEEDFHDQIEETKDIEPVREMVPFASAPQPQPTKIRIAPVNAALLLGIKNRNFKIPVKPMVVNGESNPAEIDPRAKPARVQHDTQTTVAYLPVYSIGSLHVRTVHRQMAAKSLFDAFVDKNVFVSKSEAGLEATKIEQGIFDKHLDNYKMYTNRCFAAKKSIRTGCYKNNIRHDGPKEDVVYDTLLDFVLPTEELIQFGFPMKLGDTYKCHFDGRFSFNQKWHSVKAALEKGERYCIRCFKTYEVDDDGVQIKTGCQFHPKGSRSDRRGEQQYGCGCLSRDSGCGMEPYHITESIDYTDIPGMVETDSSEDESYKKVYALDCEMVATNIGSELTHVVVVDFNRKVVYDTLCRPQGMILDYLTQYSGMTEALLSKVTTTLRDVQRDLCRLIKAEAILIGHSLDSDLRALKICHTNVVDTSIMFGIQEVPRTDPPLLRKSSLQRLVQLHLSRTIQTETSGHSAEEDAVAALELALKKANAT